MTDSNKQMRTLYLDTETTGLNAPEDKIVEISIIDDAGDIVISTLLNPEREIPAISTSIHGITNEMVKDKPVFADVWEEIQTQLKDSHLVIYNAEFDRKFFPDNLDCTKKISCCMLVYAEYIGEWNEKRGIYRWHKLINAAKWAEFEWPGVAHRALSDTLACRAVWQKLQNPPPKGAAILAKLFG